MSQVWSKLSAHWKMGGGYSVGGYGEMILYFIIPLFTVFGADYEPVIVWITDDLEIICGKEMINGCLTDMGILTENPFRYDERACNTLTHEWLHLMGLTEPELPYCIQNQEFRK